MINWFSNESHLVLNPKMPANDQELFKNILQMDFPGHLWLCTSGSIQLKLVGLSKEAFLISAKAVNDHLESNSSDVWLNPLPHFHVGGLGIVARAFLSHAKVINFQGKWNVSDFYQQLHGCTLTALVPAQIFDLVQGQFRAPPSLRGVIVGGGSLSEEPYARRDDRMCISNRYSQT
jgi:O-succinylbenzoic acid--CoA ligase